jgi:hypothetical protein
MVPVLKITRYVDRVINFLKWPIGVLGLFLLPGSIYAWKGPILAIVNDPLPTLPLFGGFAAYFLGWLLVFRRRSMGTLLSTLEHEMTHALFAILTVHKVGGIRTSWSEGGQVTILGGENWLIAIAPYWFPTFSVLLVVVLAFVPLEYLRWAAAILGLSLAYHITSTYRETHPKQSDLKYVGFPFACVFLPPANVFSYGILMAFAVGGGPGAGSYLEDLASMTLGMVKGAWALIT